MSSGEFDRDIGSADIVSFLEQGLLENLVILFRSDPSLYALLTKLLPDERIGVRLGASALVESLAEEEALAEVKHRLAGFIPTDPVDLPEVSLIELQEHHIPPFRSREYFYSDERTEWMKRFE